MWLIEKLNFKPYVLPLAPPSSSTLSRVIITWLTGLWSLPSAVAAPDHPGVGPTPHGVPGPRVRGKTAAPCRRQELAALRKCHLNISLQPKQASCPQHPHSQYSPSHNAETHRGPSGARSNPINHPRPPPFHSPTMKEEEKKK